MTYQQLATVEKEIICHLRAEGKSFNCIASILKRSSSTIRRYVHDYLTSTPKQVKTHAEMGHDRRLLDDRAERHLVRYALTNPSATDKSMGEPKIAGKRISGQTVSRILARHGIHNRMPKTKPSLVPH